MGFITTTPAGINPFTGDLNWQRLAQFLIKPGNGITLDSDGSLLLVGGGGGGGGGLAGTLSPLFTDNASNAGLNYQSPLFVSSGSLGVHVSAPLAVAGGSVNLNMNVPLYNNAGNLDVHLLAPIVNSGGSITLSFEDPFFNDSGDLGIKLGDGLVITSGSLSHDAPGTASSTYGMHGLQLTSVSSTASFPTFVFRDLSFDHDNFGHFIGTVSSPLTITFKGVISLPSAATSNTYLLTGFNGSQNWLAIPNDGKKYVPYTLNGTWSYFEVGAC